MLRWQQRHHWEGKMRNKLDQLNLLQELLMFLSLKKMRRVGRWRGGQWTLCAS